MSLFTEEDPTQHRYVDLITEVTAFEATKEPMKIISASDMLGICDAFLGETQCHISDRIPLSVAGRRELGRKIEWNCPHSWKPHEEWSIHVRHVLKILSRRYLDIPVSQQDDWQTWEELSTDIHVSVRCSRQTVEFYRSGNPQHLPLATELFAVPEDFSKFLASIVSGDIYPVWMWHADASKTPRCFDGLYPKYRHRI
ncbi:hypothetical protein [Klebsiella spallanzanii]|uniref:hypothetical protein n=1 Tax=Klebsiella spallanzanii TaxID=2587528 RepID=UPI0015D5715A|nr:hypothetical protein [Klebsiella spallanzanii]